VSTNEPLNTIPIQQFIQVVKSAENSRSNEVRIDINTAKNLAFTLGIVMSRLNGDLEKLLQRNTNSQESIQINMDGGSNF
jgi:hypothetical protein|tara:strand:- start:37816 stop:38055 length:240 start_codon:yes stop_codon:yes gene_type:complete